MTQACHVESCLPEIVGGTEAEQWEVEETYLRFTELVPDYPVCVKTIDIGELDDGVGSYSHWDRTIQIQETEPFVVGHELCHAVDLQNDIATDRDFWRVTSDEIVTARGHHRGERTEAFATACEQAFVYQGAASGICGTGTFEEQLTEAARIFEPDRVGEAASEEVYRVRLESESWSVTSTDAGMLVEDGEKARWVDLPAGVEGMESPVGFGAGQSFTSPAGWSIRQLDLFRNDGQFTRRRYLGHPEHWNEFAGCPSDNAKVFVSGEDMYSVAEEHGELVVRRWLIKWA